MVSIWANIYSQGYSSVKNGVTPNKGDSWSIVEMKIEDIGITMHTKNCRKLLVEYFFNVIK